MVKFNLYAILKILSQAVLKFVKLFFFSKYVFIFIYDIFNYLMLYTGKCAKFE